MLQDGPLPLQFLVLPRRKVRLFELVELEAVEFLPFPGGGEFLLQQPQGLRPFGEPAVGFGDVLLRRSHVLETVQEVPVRPRVQQRLVIVLSVQVDQQDAQSPEDGNGDQAAVDRAPVAPVAADLPPDDQPILLRVHADLRQQVPQLRVALSFEQPLDDRGLRTTPYGVRRGPAAENESQRADQDGLPGAGFTRKHVQSGGELDVHLVQERVVCDPQVREHRLQHERLDRVVQRSPHFSFVRRTS